MLRTPQANEGKGGALSEKQARARGNMVNVRDQVAQLAAENGLKVTDSITVSLSSIPNIMDELPVRDGQAKNGQTMNWGKFEPAIRRWERITGRPAPAPTKPDGKDGAHRLSSEFTEWMMGLPNGWITHIGLKRADELKACGNGVVPQQAALAISVLLKGVEIA